MSSLLYSIIKPYYTCIKEKNPERHFSFYLGICILRYNRRDGDTRRRNRLLLNGLSLWQRYGGRWTGRRRIGRQVTGRHRIDHGLLHDHGLIVISVIGKCPNQSPKPTDNGPTQKEVDEGDCHDAAMVTGRSDDGRNEIKTEKKHEAKERGTRVGCGE
jgi:hypothetical protein